MKTSTRNYGLGLLATALLCGGIAVTAGTAQAAAPTATASTTVNASVNSVISISANQATINLVGDPNSTAGPATGGFTVTTNDGAGYTVGVQAAAPSMIGARPGNTDTIPIANLQASAVGGSTYSSMSNTSALSLYSKASASAPGGDSSSFNLKLNVPFVSGDTYTVGLNFTATAN